jgi:hypothetical protein
MFYEVLKQVEKDFGDRAQWYSFLELINYKNSIRDTWLADLKAGLNACFAQEIVEKWGYASYTIWDYRWFIQEFGPESLRLNFDGLSLRLWANRSVLDIKKVTALLQEKKFIPVVSAFERQDNIFDENNDCKIIETGNFTFNDNDSNDGHYLNHDQIAWYAKYRTKDFVDQVKNKIDKFRKDGNITELFIEINNKCKI